MDASYGRIECPATLKQDRLERYVPGVYTPGAYQPGRFIYYHYRCDWVALAHWRGVQVAVNRYGLTCQHWYDETQTQP